MKTVSAVMLALVMVFATPLCAQQEALSKVESQVTKKLSINKATAEQLQSIPGIGPSKAAAIVDYRKANGKFVKIEDLQNVPGIGAKLLAKVKSQVTL